MSDAAAHTPPPGSRSRPGTPGDPQGPGGLAGPGEPGTREWVDMTLRQKLMIWLEFFFLQGILGGQLVAFACDWEPLPLYPYRD